MARYTAIGHFCASDYHGTIACRKDTSGDTQSVQQKRKLGFMQGEMTFPDELHWGDKQVQDLFIT